jgi:hypothetical protein
MLLSCVNPSAHQEKLATVLKANAYDLLNQSIISGMYQGKFADFDKFSL